MGNEVVAFSGCSEKRKIRMLLLKLIKQIGADKVFELAGEYGGISKYLPETTEIVVAERNKRAYGRIKHRYPRFKTYFGPASKVFAVEKGFDFAWLDFCSTYNKEAHESVKAIDIVRNGILAVTICRSRRKVFKTDPLNLILNNGYKLIDQIDYYSGEGRHGSPMTFYLLIKTNKHGRR